MWGAPPGYVGYEEGGDLTEKIRRRPYSVVLMDEIEKAHPDVFNILLQVMEEGELSDNLGHTVDFRNTVIIMTSNVGAKEITKDSSLGFSSFVDKERDFTDMKEKALSELKRQFNPEFLNRVDEIVVFHSLSYEHIEEILDIMIREITDRLKERGYTLAFTTEAKRFLIDKGFDKKYGARPLRRAIQREVEDSLAQRLLQGDFPAQGMIHVELAGDGKELFFRLEQVAPDPERDGEGVADAGEEEEDREE